MLAVCLQDNACHGADAVVIQNLLKIRHLFVAVAGDNNGFAAIFHVGDQFVCFLFTEVILRGEKHDAVCIVGNALLGEEVQILHLDVFFLNGRFHIIGHCCLFVTGDCIHNRQ